MKHDFQVLWQPASKKMQNCPHFLPLDINDSNFKVAPAAKIPILSM